MSADNVTMKRRATDWQQPATSSSLTEHADGSVTLSHKRLNVCLEAAWEIDALADLLPTIVPCSDELSTPAHLVVRGMADRIKRLSIVLMSGLHDDAATLEALERKVFVSRRAVA